MSGFQSDYLSQHDAVSNTLMLSENLQATQWVPLNGDGRRRMPREADVGMLWTPNRNSRCSTGADIVGINQCQRSNPGPQRFARPSSYHPGGVIVSFCAGDQRFINEGISWTVYKHLMTPDSEKADTSLTQPFDPGSL